MRWFWSLLIHHSSVFPVSRGTCDPTSDLTITSNCSTPQIPHSNKSTQTTPSLLPLAGPATFTMSTACELGPPAFWFLYSFPIHVPRALFHLDSMIHHFNNTLDSILRSFNVIKYVCFFIYNLWVSSLA